MARPEELRCRPNSLTLLLDEEEENPASPVDVLRPHLGQVLEGTGGDPGMGEELIQIPLIGPAGVGEGVRSSQAATARSMASRRLPGT
jgi:hypothetical protein